MIRGVVAGDHGLRFIAQGSQAGDLVLLLVEMRLDDAVRPAAVPAGAFLSFMRSSAVPESIRISFPLQGRKRPDLYELK